MAYVHVVLVVQIPQVQVVAPVMQAVRVPQVVIIPVAAQRPTSTVSLTMEIPQLLLDEVVDVLMARVPQVPSWRRQLCSHSCTC